MSTVTDPLRTRVRQPLREDCRLTLIKQRNAVAAVENSCAADSRDGEKSRKKPQNSSDKMSQQQLIQQPQHKQEQHQRHCYWALTVCAHCRNYTTCKCVLTCFSKIAHHREVQLVDAEAARESIGVLSPDQTCIPSFEGVSLGTILDLDQAVVDSGMKVVLSCEMCTGFPLGCCIDAGHYQQERYTETLPIKSVKRARRTRPPTLPEHNMPLAKKRKTRDPSPSDTSSPAVAATAAVVCLKSISSSAQNREEAEELTRETPAFTIDGGETGTVRPALTSGTPQETAVGATATEATASGGTSSSYVHDRVKKRKPADGKTGAIGRACPGNETATATMRSASKMTASGTSVPAATVSAATLPTGVTLRVATDLAATAASEKVAALGPTGGDEATRNPRGDTSKAREQASDDREARQGDSQADASVPSERIGQEATSATTLETSSATMGRPQRSELREDVRKGVAKKPGRRGDMGSSSGGGDSKPGGGGEAAAAGSGIRVARVPEKKIRLPPQSRGAAKLCFEKGPRPIGRAGDVTSGKVGALRTGRRVERKLADPGLSEGVAQGLGKRRGMPPTSRGAAKANIGRCLRAGAGGEVVSGDNKGVGRTLGRVGKTGVAGAERDAGMAKVPAGRKEMPPTSRGSTKLNFRRWLQAGTGGEVVSREERGAGWTRGRVKGPGKRTDGQSRSIVCGGMTLQLPSFVYVQAQNLKVQIGWGKAKFSVNGLPCVSSSLHLRALSPGLTLDTLTAQTALRDLVWWKKTGKIHQLVAARVVEGSFADLEHLGPDCPIVIVLRDSRTSLLNLPKPLHTTKRRLLEVDLAKERILAALALTVRSRSPSLWKPKANGALTASCFGTDGVSEGAGEPSKRRNTEGECPSHWQGPRRSASSDGRSVSACGDRGRASAVRQQTPGDVGTGVDQSPGGSRQLLGLDVVKSKELRSAVSPVASGQSNTSEVPRQAVVISNAAAPAGNAAAISLATRTPTGDSGHRGEHEATVTIVEPHEAPASRVVDVPAPAAKSAASAKRRECARAPASGSDSINVTIGPGRVGDGKFLGKEHVAHVEVHDPAGDTSAGAVITVLKTGVRKVEREESRQGPSSLNGLALPARGTDSDGRVSMGQASSSSMLSSPWSMVSVSLTAKSSGDGSCVKSGNACAARVVEQSPASPLSASLSPTSPSSSLSSCWSGSSLPVSTSGRAVLGTNGHASGSCGTGDPATGVVRVHPSPPADLKDAKRSIGEKTDDTAELNGDKNYTRGAIEGSDRATPAPSCGDVADAVHSSESRSLVATAGAQERMTPGTTQQLHPYSFTTAIGGAVRDERNTMARVGGRKRDGGHVEHAREVKLARFAECQRRELEETKRGCRQELAPLEAELEALKRKLRERMKGVMDRHARDREAFEDSLRRQVASAEPESNRCVTLSPRVDAGEELEEDADAIVNLRCKMKTELQDLKSTGKSNCG